MIRIIAGKHKNRIIPSLKNAKYRPSTSKLREAIFSTLNSGEFNKGELFKDHIKILDLFSGTGSLAFEALSRGAGEITLVDVNAEYLATAYEFSILIGELKNVFFIKINALNLPKATKTFDLIFIDPPYYKNLVPPTIDNLIKNSWLNEGAILVVEMAKSDIYDNPKLELVKEKIYGNSRLMILRYNYE